MTGVDLECYSCTPEGQDQISVVQTFDFDKSPYRTPESKPTMTCSAQPIDLDGSEDEGGKLKGLDLGGFNIQPFSKKQTVPSAVDPNPAEPEGGVPSFSPDDDDTELCAADANKPAPSSSDDDEDHTLAIVIASVVGGLVVVAGIVYLVRSRYASYEQIA